MTGSLTSRRTSAVSGESDTVLPYSSISAYSRIPPIGDIPGFPYPHISIDSDSADFYPRLCQTIRLDQCTIDALPLLRACYIVVDRITCRMQIAATSARRLRAAFEENASPTGDAGTKIRGSPCTIWLSVWDVTTVTLLPFISKLSLCE
jgi:hypothetical protein